MINTRRLILMVAVFFIFLIPVISMAGTVNLPRTNQSWVFYHGDDGDLLVGAHWPRPRFIDNGDGTITDKLTGLMWLQDTLCLHYWIYPRRRYTETWGEALDTVVWFNLKRGRGYNCSHYTASYHNWRVPNFNELRSLVPEEPARKSPATWLKDRGFRNMLTTSYWSSTSTNTSRAWCIESHGSLAATCNKNDSYSVIAVRSGQAHDPDRSYPANVWDTGQKTSFHYWDDGFYKWGVDWPNPRFTDNHDGTVTDNLTKRMWLRDANCMKTHYRILDTDGWPSGDGRVSWQHALDFVDAINGWPLPECGKGYSDWRLPNIIELRSLIDFSQDAPSLPQGHPFLNWDTDDIRIPIWNWWSSSTYRGTPFWYLGTSYGTAQGVEFYHARITRTPKEMEDTLYSFVWPVRSIVPIYVLYYPMLVIYVNGGTCDIIPPEDDAALIEETMTLGDGIVTFYFLEPGYDEPTKWGTLYIQMSLIPGDKATFLLDWPQKNRQPSDEATIYWSYQTELIVSSNNQAQPDEQGPNATPTPSPNPKPTPTPTTTPTPTPPPQRTHTVYAYPEGTHSPRILNRAPLLKLDLSYHKRFAEFPLFGPTCQTTPLGRIDFILTDPNEN